MHDCVRWCSTLLLLLGAKNNKKNPFYVFQEKNADKVLYTYTYVGQEAHKKFDANELASTKNRSTYMVVKPRKGNKNKILE